MLMVSIQAMESLASIDLKWGKTMKKTSETMKPTTINSANHAS